jgi:formate-dependent nitrite reductase cytochrome c552 subunit
MASDTAAAADNVDKMSQKIGISRTAYQEWDYVMSQNGMSVDKLQTGIKTLTSKMDAAKNGTASATEAFQRLGYRLRTRTAPCARKRRFSRKL